jgi:hypothetical protein
MALQVEKATTRDPMKKREAEERKEDWKLEIESNESREGRPWVREDHHPHGGVGKLE